MGATSPDNIRYPSDYILPADIPNHMQTMANDVQLALNKHMDVAVVIGELTPGAGWAHYGTPYGNLRFYKTGRIVVCMGLLRRTAALTVVDNNEYTMGTIPGGYRPLFDIRAAVGWVANNGSNRQFMASQIHAQAAGELLIQSNVAGSMAIDDWVSMGGISWLTP